MSFSEREFIKRIRAALSEGKARGLVAGIGDDCAVFRWSENDSEQRFGLATTDALVDSIHFDLSWHPAGLLGRKSLSVNISDIAAMGGRPLYALLTLGVSGEGMSGFAEEFMSGFFEVLLEHEMELIGGDTVRSVTPFISVTVIGDVDKERILYRSGAKVGDDVWVSGFLGNAAAGLEICRRGLAKDRGNEQMVAAHLNPTPQIALGEALGASGLVNAMMDVSDGIATDLSHLCAESGVGAEIEENLIPLSEELLAAAGVLQHSPLDWALSGGEDYQLLFTASASNGNRLKSLIKESIGVNISRIGRIVKGEGVHLRSFGKTVEVSYSGFDHFSPGS